MKWDVALLGVYTGFCAGLYWLLWRFYMPSVGTAWEGVMVALFLATTAALLLWVVFIGVFVRVHIIDPWLKG